ncbi:MAG TPA: glycoside hydrolase family 3 N-terminal domain-containing protein, partial [Verrucomicrobiae bacterium]|nr:glycoside hydrolase family 3 N-terminal domain-containing protein [Verrucomicrobiae bacterium]
PRVRRSRRALAALELVPFARAVAARIPALMTAHVVYPALDPRRPATLSPAICRDLLRRRLGFRGVLFSDDLEMNAVAARSTPARSAVAALRAGCDMLLVCQSLDAARAAMRGVEDAVVAGTLPAADVATALGRIAALRHRLRPAPRATPLGWPAHQRLASRLAAASS